MTREEHLLRLLRAANQRIEVLEESLELLQASARSREPYSDAMGMLAFTFTGKRAPEYSGGNYD